MLQILFIPKTMSSWNCENYRCSLLIGNDTLRIIVGCPRWVGVACVVRVWCVVCVVRECWDGCACVMCGVVLCVVVWCVCGVWCVVWCGVVCCGVVCVVCDVWCCGVCVCCGVVWCVMCGVVWCVMCGAWCVVLCCGVVWVVWCVVGLGTRKTLRVWIQNASVCTFRMPPWVPATRPHVSALRVRCWLRCSSPWPGHFLCTTVLKQDRAEECVPRHSAYQLPQL